MKVAVSDKSPFPTEIGQESGDQPTRQACFEARARASLADYRRSGVACSVDEVFKPIKAQFDARRKALRGD